MSQTDVVCRHTVTHLGKTSDATASQPARQEIKGSRHKLLTMTARGNKAPTWWILARKLKINICVCSTCTAHRCWQCQPLHCFLSLTWDREH
ncbi:hypothetical protein ACOMHN_005101 [Nucella lapillus]